MKNKKTYYQNAFTSIPVQNNYNQMGFLECGLSRIEIIALRIYTSTSVTITEAIQLAVKFIDEIEQFKDEFDNPITPIIEIK
jgi:hypothetical protein